MTTILYSLNVTNHGNIAYLNSSTTYKKEGDLSSYRVNIDAIGLQEVSTFGVCFFYVKLSQKIFYYIDFFLK